jgi:hypothetical protein
MAVGTVFATVAFQGPPSSTPTILVSVDFAEPAAGAGTWSEFYPGQYDYTLMSTESTGDQAILIVAFTGFQTQQITVPTTSSTNFYAALQAAIANLTASLTTGQAAELAAIEDDCSTLLENANNIAALNNKFIANMPYVTVASTVGIDGSTITLIAGDSYDPFNSEGRLISVDAQTAGNATALSTAIYTLTAPGLGTITIPSPTVNMTVGTMTFLLGLTPTQTAAMYSGRYNITAHWYDGNLSTIVKNGNMIIIP